MSRKSRANRDTRVARRGTGRRGGRFAGMFRHNPYRWGGLGFVVMSAALLGAQLGQSAIAGINPLYFEGAPPPVRAVDGRERQPAQPAYYQAYDWEQGRAARAIACGDNCGAPAPYDAHAYAETSAVPLPGTAWRDRTPVAELEPWAPGQVSREQSAAVMRYADYPVEEKPVAEGGEDGPIADDQQADVYEDE